MLFPRSQPKLSDDQREIPSPPSDAARLFQDAIAELGWDADPVAIAEQVRRLNIGLPAEDEFAVLCAWLGKCDLIHKLDQAQGPSSSRDRFQVPDFLASFSTATTPVLVEVKSKASKTLSFRSDYYERLSNYAGLVGLPILVAWKFHSLWTVFELRQMRKAVSNYNIRFEEAMTQSLLCSLVGDVGYRIGSGAGMHLHFMKENLLDIHANEEERSSTWMVRFDSITFTDYLGGNALSLSDEVQELFKTWDLSERDADSDTHVTKSFVASDRDGMQFAHTALVRLLDWETAEGESANWRGLARQEKILRSISDFRSVLKKALEERIVDTIIDIRPKEMPAFLKTQS